MDYHLIWKAALIVLVGTFLLKFSGRKTISQMTLAETVIMISLGTLLINPVVSKNIWITFAVGLVLVFTLLIMDYLQIKSDTLEHLITGKSKILIENGKIKEKNLLKSHMTVDQLEMNLRQKNVSNISDVLWATLEPTGQIGFILKKEAQPVTQKEFQQLQQTINMFINNQTENNQYQQTINNQFPLNQQNQQNIFQEVKYQKHKHSPPEHLQ